jgi:hypothetical protein
MDLMKEDLIFVITFGLYTKFIEAEREHTCGKTQISPILPDTIEGTGALVPVMDVSIKAPLNALLPPFPLARERLRSSTLCPT